jgi:hypothetical protein
VRRVASNIYQANTFTVEGEKRYWLHPPSVAAAISCAAGVAIDRLTEQLFDKKIEVINE